MTNFREISPDGLSGNVFQRIGKDWMLIAAGDGERVNMMTASWGGMGILWNKPVVFAFIRPQRYTRELVEAADTFSLTFFDESYREQLKLCGSKSGRDIDKVAACGFEVCEDGAPYFAQANAALICKKLYRQQLAPECFLETALDAANYPGKDYHQLYIGEIVKALVK